MVDKWEVCNWHGPWLYIEVDSQLAAGDKYEVQEGGPDTLLSHKYS